MKHKKMFIGLKAENATWSHFPLFMLISKNCEKKNKNSKNK